jgi:hypothetical protein
MMVNEIKAAQLGRLLRRDAREVWQHEAHQFTPWLHDHIAELNEAIGFEIELLGREERVGPFAVDLYGREVQTGHPAIIENQLEPSDHTHLGQLLTYAAGLKAGIIVWITPQFRDEHRAALTWLNEISPQEVSFFGVELEVLEINEQRAANFKLVVQPNNWLGSRATTGTGLVPARTERAQAYQSYFTTLLQQLKRRSPGIATSNKASSQNWCYIASAKNGVAFNWVFGTNSFRIEVYIDTTDRERNIAIFDALLQQRQEIEQELGTSLSWERLEDRQAKRIAILAPFEATTVLSPPAELEEWAISNAIRLVNTFRPRVRALSI